MFTHAANSRIVSISDVFTKVSDIPDGLSERWGVGGADPGSVRVFWHQPKLSEALGSLHMEAITV